jgi:dihydroflavonol-4-reductase
MAAEDRVLVTGASGFVGSAVALAAEQHGLKVRVLVRPTSPRVNLSGLDCEIAEGDMCDPDAMNRALRGVRHLFHVAADYRLWARDPGEILRTNLTGTRVVMEAAQRQGVERIVYTSSVATLRPNGAAAPVDESARLDETEAIGAYKRSKIAAERLVERLIAESGLPAIIVNPSTPIGPRDVRPTPTGRMIVEAARGRMPAFVDTGLNLVSVDDVAAGHMLALEKGKIGERYILGGSDVLLRDLLSEIARLTDRRPPRVKLPRWPLYPIALAAEAMAKTSGKEPFVTIDGLRMSRYRMFFSSAKAERELGYKARPYGDGLQAAVAWFQERGYLA